MDKIAVTVDIVCFRQRQENMQIALIRRRYPPFLNHWALPGGFVEIEEDLIAAARRELKEETDLEAYFIKQFHCFGAPLRDPRGRTISIAHIALIESHQEGRAGDDAAALAWHELNHLPELAFDHSLIIEIAKETLKDWNKLGLMEGYV